MCITASRGQVSVLTQRNDNYRSGVNTAEITLNVGNVTSSTFGKIGSAQVDGQIYSQPLYVPNVPALGATINLVVVATENDSVYAFNADDLSSGPVWKQSFINPGAGVTTVPSTDITPYLDIHPQYGITSTPVINWNSTTQSGSIYVVATTKEVVGSAVTYVFRLHVLDVATGTEAANSPVVLSGSVPGVGTGSANGVMTFNPKIENQRAALTISNGTLYIAFGSHADYGNYHGWLMAYDTTSLAQTGIWCSCANNESGGIWQGGQGLTVDTSGNLLFVTGNGDLTPSVGDYGDSFLKMSQASAGLTVLDYFAPYNEWQLDYFNQDLGSSGPLYLPSQNLLVGGGKNSWLYVLNESNLGKNNGIDDSAAVENWPGIAGFLMSTPIAYLPPTGGGNLFVGAQYDYLRAYSYTGSATTPFSQNPTWVSSERPGSGAPMSISSNGSTPATGVLWATMTVPGGDGSSTVVGGEMCAYDVRNMRELWNSTINSSDAISGYGKFVCPTVANGKVYVPCFGADNGTTPNALYCYGLANSISSPPPTPTGLAKTAGNGFNRLTWTPTPGAVTYSLYRSPNSKAPTLYQSGIAENTFTDSAVVNGTSYTYAVKAVNPAGSSSLSSTVSSKPVATMSLYSYHCGGPAISGFSADNRFTGGTAISAPPSIPPTSVYSTARTGTFSYRVFGLQVGQNYSLNLAFCDLEYTQAGQRQMDVLVNGSQLISGLDLIATAGPLTGFVRTCTVQPAADGSITIACGPSAGSPVQTATLSGFTITGSQLTVPDVVSSLVPYLGTGGMRLKWKSTSGSPLYYNIYRGTASGAEQPWVKGVYGTGYIDYTGTPNTPYYYYVTAVSLNGESAPGNEVVCTAYDYALTAPGITLSNPVVISRSSGSSKITLNVSSPGPALNTMTMDVYYRTTYLADLSFSEEDVAAGGSTVVTFKGVKTAPLGPNTISITATYGPILRYIVIPVIITN
jgi:hypothetical protein